MEEKDEPFLYILHKWLKLLPRLLAYVGRRLPPATWVKIFGCIVLFFCARHFGVLKLYWIFLISFIILTNLGSRRAGEKSAYSVFNRNQERLPGQLTAEDFERQIRHLPRGFPLLNGDDGRHDAFENAEEAESDTHTAGGSKGEGSAAGVIGRAGRNQLCPCGSGKKFKKCCALLTREDDDDNNFGGSHSSRRPRY
eukprot:Rmarinus@m.14868